MAQPAFPENDFKVIPPLSEQTLSTGCCLFALIIGRRRGTTQIRESPAPPPAAWTLAETGRASLQVVPPLLDTPPFFRTMAVHRENLYSSAVGRCCRRATREQGML